MGRDTVTERAQEGESLGLVGRTRNLRGQDESDANARRSNAHTRLSFLAEHPEQGFTPKEIHEATGVTCRSVGKTLQRLEERQLVRHAEPYWAIGEDNRVGAYFGMLSSLDTVAGREGIEHNEE